ncbi:MAG: hypothetical protein ACRDIB_01150, partial [Ardenticatenaceae bacterium]
QAIYSDWISYRGPTYYAAALLFDDLRQLLGDEAFHEAMRRLLGRFAFEEVQTADVRDIFEAVSTEQGVSLDGFWEHWLEE